MAWRRDYVCETHGSGARLFQGGTTGKIILVEVESEAAGGMLKIQLSASCKALPVSTIREQNAFLPATGCFATKLQLH